MSTTREALDRARAIAEQLEYFIVDRSDSANEEERYMTLFRKLVALAAEPLHTAGWQPIATAPDGTMILICDMTATEARNWCFVDWLVRGLLIAHPLRHATHWMPLPSPPQEPTD